MTHDWTALREMAEKATRGPWEASPPLPSIGFIGDYWAVGTKDDGYLERATLDVSDHLNAKHDAEFIAAANPTAIAALLDENERLRAEVAEAKATINHLFGSTVDQKKRARTAEAALDRVKAMTFASDDGTEWEHNDRCEGEPSCPACWAADILRAIAGEV